MSSIETAPREESTGLSSSRAEFASSLSRRLESVLGALSALEQQPESAGRRDNFLRRVHALGASAKVLGFAAAAEIFARAEQQIRTSQVDTLADDILAVRRCLSDLPALVLRGAYSIAPQARPPSTSPSAPPLITEPLAVVAWCTPDLLAMLRSLDKSSSTLELTGVADPDKLRDACIALGPDLLLLDANQGSITLLVDELAQAPEVANVPIVVANVPEEAASGLLELGARVVLPARCTEQQIARALVQAHHVPAERAPTPSPIGEVTLKDLAERLAQEIREGLVDAAVPSAHIERIDLGEGTPIRAALWSALAQIREHVLENSGGRVQFVAGPEGAVPLAPRAGDAARRAGRMNVDSVDLTGRRILVVDDDPAVAWFVGGTLRAAGAVVTESHDGAQALEIACRLWPELIVSDVMMPGLDGFALCHAIKRDVLLRDVPIVLLSWKEDLLFRLRDLGADADGYLRKEASASTIVRRVRELLASRSALEHRLSFARETRGRLDGTTVRLLLELAAGLGRPVRIALRDASALYDIRLRHGSLAAVTRTRHDGTVEHGQSVLSAMLGITAGRFSVVSDNEPCDPMFSGSLLEILGPSVLRARAAQRVLSGLRLGLVDRLTLEPDAFGSDLPLLPMSLRPIADELLRGTAPRQLLASGVASVQLLESLLSDVARRGAVRGIADTQGEDLLEQEILELSSTPSIVPPKPAPPPLFTFQLSPMAPQARESSAAEIHAPTSPTPTLAPVASSAVEWQGKPSGSERQDASRDLPSGTLSGVGRGGAAPAMQAGTAAPAMQARAQLNTGASSAATEQQPSIPAKATTAQSIPTLVGPSAPVSNAPPVDDVDWAMEFNWDSTPPPAGSDAKAAAAGSFDGKPATSGGFMRPAIATLERRALQVTPDLANAVVQAVSDATPRPADAPQALGSASTAAAPPAQPKPRQPGSLSNDAGGVRGPAASAVATVDFGEQPATATHAADIAMERPLAPPLDKPAQTPPLPDKSAPASPLADKPAQTPPLPDKLAPVLSLAEKPANPHLPDRLAPAPPLTDKPAQTPPLADAGTQTPPLPDRMLQAPPHAEPVDTPADRQLDQSRTSRATTSDTAANRTFAESPTALPVVHQPPRPKLEPVVDKAPEPLPTNDGDSEDPVFPLVSTANVTVEVQPSIEVGTSEVKPAYESLAPSDLTSLEPKPPEPKSTETRDTLRSPEDSQREGSHREGAKPLFETAVAVSPRVPSRTDRGGTGTNGSASAPPSRPNASEPAPIAASSPPSSGAKAQQPRSPLQGSATAAQPPRPVGWIQALGLAALAGIVTFAITVPIASWIRKRHDPVRTEPPVATQTLEGTAPSARPDIPNEGVQGATPSSIDSAGTRREVDSSVASAPSGAAAQIEEIPVPADVALQPGQALIEVLTGGGHAIFLDDSFVGRGPVRVITVQPGHHVVRTRLNGVERSDPIDVGAGRSLRVSLEQAWK